MQRSPLQSLLHTARCTARVVNSSGLSCAAVHLTHVLRPASLHYNQQSIVIRAHISSCRFPTSKKPLILMTTGSCVVVCNIAVKHATCLGAMMHASHAGPAEPTHKHCMSGANMGVPWSHILHVFHTYMFLTVACTAQLHCVPQLHVFHSCVYSIAVCIPTIACITQLHAFPSRMYSTAVCVSHWHVFNACDCTCRCSAASYCAGITCCMTDALKQPKLNALGQTQKPLGSWFPSARSRSRHSMARLSPWKTLLRQ